MKLRSNKTTTLSDVQKTRSVKLEHKDSPDSNVSTSQAPSTKFAGVSKHKDGYCARIKHPVSKKQLWLGTFKSAEEASAVYLAKKTELEKKQRISGGGCVEEIKKVVDEGGVCGGKVKEEGLGGDGDDPCEGNQESSSLQIGSRKSRGCKRKIGGVSKSKRGRKQRISGEVCVEEIKKVGDQGGVCGGEVKEEGLGGGDDDPCWGNQESCSLQVGLRKSRVVSKKGGSCRRKIGGVSKSKWGGYGARITHPVSKKRIWLGTFGSVEEAEMACAVKNKEVEEELRRGGREGVQGGVCDEEIKKVVDHSGTCLENQEVSLQIDCRKEGISKKKKNQDSSLRIDSRKEGISKKKKRKNQDSSLQIDSRLEGILKNNKVVDQSGQCLVENGTNIGEENRESSLQIDSRTEGILNNNKVVDQSGECLVENGTNKCEKNQESLLQIDSRKEGVSKSNKVVDQSGQGLVENGTNICEENQEPSLQIDPRKARISKKKKKKRNQDSSLQIDARKATISKKKKKCPLSERVIVGFVGVSQSKSGKYVARITHPVTKKKIWLGTFASAEEASMVYLTKKTELQKEVQGNKGVEKSTAVLGPILEERNHHPCSNNQDSAMKIEPIDSFNGERASRMEDLPIQTSVASAEKELSVDSESGAEILLRTESGAPLMDSHGFLLGSWSWIDDLSLPIV